MLAATVKAATALQAGAGGHLLQGGAAASGSRTLIEILVNFDVDKQLGGGQVMHPDQIYIHKGYKCDFASSHVQ